MAQYLLYNLMLKLLENNLFAYINYHKDIFTHINTTNLYMDPYQDA